MKVVYTKAALRALMRMPAGHAERVWSKIKQYALDSGSLANNVRALAGSSYLRLRFGDDRVIMLHDGTVVEVVAIGSRGDIYEKIGR
jgi:mRNA interferase RelE/StbE